jgi:sRNA-binding regulator protein Hfq
MISMPDEPRDYDSKPETAGPEQGSEGGDNHAPLDTHQEVAYLRQLVQSQTPVVVKLRSGETVTGYIEYYDKRFIRLTRRDGPNLFIFKTDIKYLYEAAGPRLSGGRHRI